MGAIWITGASGAIGSALAHSLQATGRPLVLTGRDVDSLNALASSLDVRTVVKAADLSEPDAAADVLADAVEELGQIDGFAHCVGSTLIRPLHLTTHGDLERVVRHNFFSAAWALKAFIALQLEQQSAASAVLVGSLVARAGFPNHEAIASAKAAVAALSESAAATYAERGIRVNCVHPGLTISKMSARLTSTPEAVARNAKSNPMGRLGDGQDTASVIAFLLSDAARWITGQQISVDGGHAVLHPLPKV
ncbi:MAG: SDR family oxidoreductase [Burkholderiales bacterium]|nr:SDR family oxidoreductase [Burkholderiales bacterium]